LRKESKKENNKKKTADKDGKFLAIGMYCSGFPVLMIGFAQLIDDMMKSSSYSSVSFIYYFVGMAMVAWGMKVYHRDNKWIITVIITTIILVITTLLKILIFKSPV